MNQSNPTMTGLSPGDKLDKYEIVEQIGAGGMSVVWKGFDRLLNKHVAIKQLNLDAVGDAEDEMRERFMNEAQVQKRVSLNNPHLVKIIDFISEQRGYFIVMELVEGSTLEQLLVNDGKPMGREQAMGLVGGTALALQSIHRHDIVHRDLKPSNILLPDAGGLKICDFGLATLIDEQEALSVGSVRYMAPELFGDEPVDGRADIYALGMIAYEMLAGRQKFNDVFKIVLRDQRNQALRWMKWHTNSRVQAPPLHEVNPQVPQDLSELVSRMMEKDVAKRITSAEELIEAIRRHFSGEAQAPTTPEAGGAGAAAATAPSTAEKTAPLPEKNNVPMLMGLTVLLWIGAIGGFFMMQSLGERSMAMEERNDAERAYAAARQEMHNGEYAAAIKTFDELAGEWQMDPVLGVGSSVRADLCRARLAMESRNYQQALDLLTSVAERDQLDPDYIEAIRREAATGLAIQRTFDKVSGLITNKQFAVARRELRDLQAITPLDEVGKREASDLLQRADREELQYNMDQHLKRAQDQVDAGNLDLAKTQLREGIDQYQDPRMEALLAKLELDENHSQALARADRAERQGQYDEAIAALRNANRLKPDNAIQPRINRLEAEKSYEAGLAALRNGQTASAKSAFENTLRLAPSHEGAQRNLNDIQQANDKDSLVRAGDRARANGELDAALASYRKAIAEPFGPDSSVTSKIRAIQVEQALAAAQEAMDADTKDNLARLDRAQQAYQRVLQLDSGNRQATGALAEISKWRQFYELINQVAEARASSDYRQAKLLLRRVDLIFDQRPPQAQQLADDIEYESMIAQAKAAMAKEQWESARSWLQTAAQTRMTEEITALRQEIDKHAPTLEDR